MPVTRRNNIYTIFLDIIVNDFIKIAVTIGHGDFLEGMQITMKFNNEC